MKCPSCKSPRVQQITDDGLRLYCVDCNHAWKKETPTENPSGEMSFNGVPAAKQIFEALTKGQNLTPEFRAALESQITAILLDQWFNGFKAGQMASILYAKEHYGKDRNDTSATTSSCNQGKRGSGIQNFASAGSGEKRGNGTGKCGCGQASGTKKQSDTTVRKRIGRDGVELTYPRNVLVPENLEKALAYVTQEVFEGKLKVKGATYNGHKCLLDLDYGSFEGWK